MLSYRIDSVTGIVHVEGNQTAGGPEFIALLGKALADPAYPPDFGFLRDRRGMFAMQTSIVRDDVAALRALFGKTSSRWAFVTTDPVNYGMARMASSFLEGSPIEMAIFDRLETAVQWLSQRPAPDAAEEP